MVTRRIRVTHRHQQLSPWAMRGLRLVGMMQDDLIPAYQHFMLSLDLPENTERGLGENKIPQRIDHEQEQCHAGAKSRGLGFFCLLMLCVAVHGELPEAIACVKKIKVYDTDRNHSVNI